MNANIIYIPCLIPPFNPTGRYLFALNNDATAMNPLIDARSNIGRWFNISRISDISAKNNSGNIVIIKDKLLYTVIVNPSSFRAYTVNNGNPIPYANTENKIKIKNKFSIPLIYLDLL